MNALVGLLAQGLVVALLAGCAITHSVRQDLLPPPEARALVEPWPLGVGFYVAPAVRTQVIAHQGWRMPAGEAVDANFRWTVAQLFAHVIVLDRPPAAGTPPPGLAGVIELAGLEYEPGSAGSLRYRLALYSGTGERLDAWTVSSPLLNWDAAASSLTASLQGVGSELAYAMRDLGAQFMVHFADRPAARAWLAGAGVPDAALRPAWQGTAADAEANRVMLLPDIGTWLHTDSAQAMRCVGGRLAQASPAVQVVPADRVRLALFPWLEPSTAPKTPEALRRWLDEPAIRRALQAAGVRYLLEFRGGTQTDIPGGGILCGAGYGGGGCLGFAWGSRESAFHATLIDTQRTNTAQAADVRQRGKVYVPAFGLPVPLMAATETAACDELARQIRAMLQPTQP